MSSESVQSLLSSASSPALPTSNMAAAPDSSTGLNFGSGLVEIAALTSLIGSEAAEALALGSKGPAGLVWANMTVFGAMTVARSFLAAAIPGWLRNTVGVRTGRADATTGFTLDLKKAFKHRAHNERAKGIECEVISKDKHQENDSPIHAGHRDVYAFDQRTTNILRALSPSQPGEPLNVYSFLEDAWYTGTLAKHSRIDWILFGLSLTKIGDVFVLWRFGAIFLAIVTMSTFIFFFLAGFLLHLYFLNRRDGHSAEIDILMGELPTPSRNGGERTILLETTKDIRHHTLWSLTWGVGSIVCLISVVATYIALGDPSSENVFWVWVGFQVAWLLCRSVLFHLLEDREKPYQIGLKGKPWVELRDHEKIRVQNLTLALSKHQQYLHPRGMWSYGEDVETMTSLKNFQNIAMNYPLKPDISQIQVSVRGVIGDTLLHSVSWIFGSKQGGFDLYDCCIVIFDINNTVVSIPAARVLSSNRLTATVNPEDGTQILREPRGGTNRVIDTEWYYWIPCGDDKWLYFSSDLFKFNGSRSAVVLSDAEVSKNLRRGDLRISLQQVGEVKAIVQSSVTACAFLAKLLDVPL